MFTLNCKGRLLIIDKPIVMGIINVTPDSFYKNSRNTSVSDAVLTASEMINHGAAILDIGGQSTRPGAETVSADEERKRVLPVIKDILNQLPNAIISIDTYYSAVAKAAAEAGALIINDISGGSIDAGMITTVAHLKLPYIAMHLKGTPATMQSLATYNHVTNEVLDYFNQLITRYTKAGIKDIIIDPGFGFAKTTEHNLRLLRELSVFKMLNKPILVGLSRKATIYKTLEVNPEDALNGTTVLNTIALLNGADILRVHDVKAATEAIKLVDACRFNNRDSY